MFRLTNATIDGSGLGARIPALFVVGQSRKLYAGHTTLRHWVLEDIGVGWHAICITQRLVNGLYKFHIKINGKLVVNEVQPEPMEYKNVDFYMPDHYEPVKGEYRNLAFLTTSDNIDN